jgi:hypothetical protein
MSSRKGGDIGSDVRILLLPRVTVRFRDGLTRQPHRHQAVAGVLDGTVLDVRGDVDGDSAGLFDASRISAQLVEGKKETQIASSRRSPLSCVRLRPRFRYQSCRSESSGQCR